MLPFLSLCECCYMSWSRRLNYWLSTYTFISHLSYISLYGPILTYEKTTTFIHIWAHFKQAWNELTFTLPDIPKISRNRLGIHSFGYLFFKLYFPIETLIIQIYHPRCLSCSSSPYSKEMYVNDINCSSSRKVPKCEWSWVNAIYRSQFPHSKDHTHKHTHSDPPLGRFERVTLGDSMARPGWAVMCNLARIV